MLLLVQLGRDVKDVLVPGQRHRESVAFDDAVQRVLFHLVGVVDVQHCADLLDNVLKQRIS